MRNSLIFSTLFFSFFSFNFNLNAQNLDQYARNSAGNGNQATAGIDTLSQSLIKDYGLTDMLPGVIVVTGEKPIVLRPVIKGKAEVVNGKVIFKKFTDLVISPYTQGIIIPNGVKKSNGKVIEVSGSFWKPDSEGPRDDLFLPFAPATDIKGSFIFSPEVGAKIKVGIYDYIIIENGGVCPVTLKSEEKNYEIIPAPGRLPETTKPKQKK